MVGSCVELQVNEDERQAELASEELLGAWIQGETHPAADDQAYQVAFLEGELLAGVGAHAVAVLA